MPTYEYACKRCGEHLEVVQSFRDDPLTTCPACEGELRKVFGAIGIAFKGSGFYKTDSRTAAGERGDGKARSGEGTREAKSGEAKGDGAKSGGAKGDGAKSGGAKGDGAKSESKSSSKADSKAAASS